MKTLLLTTSLALTALGTAGANEVVSGSPVPIYEPVDSFYLQHRLDGWRAVDEDTLLVWATPFRPYLIELTRRSPDLRFSETIGVTSTVGTVTRFDSVLVRGFDYPIKAIYKLSREQARELRQAQPDDESA